MLLPTNYYLLTTMKLFIKSTLVPFILWYFRMIAHIALSQTKATIIGVAGSVGKTSTREALYAILKDVAPTHMVAGNSETGVPLGLVGLFPHDYSPTDWLRMIFTAPFNTGKLKNITYLIVEMGIDDPHPPKNMDYLLSIVRPHIGIITEESAAHTMQFEKMLKPNIVRSDKERLTEVVTAITREDAKMIKQDACKLGIVNGDNTFLAEEFSSKGRKEIQTFGTTDKPTIELTAYDVTTHKTTFSYTLRTKEEEAISLTFKGYAFPKELGLVFAPAILAAQNLDIPLSVIKKNLEASFTPPKGRESLFEGIHDSVIIDSSYNASRPSVISFLDLTHNLKKQTKRHAIVILADMLELGNEAQIEHETVARAVSPVADTLYLVGPLTKRFILPIVEKEGKIKSIKWFPTITELNIALRDIPAKSLILVKGSQGDLWLEESIKLLLKNKSDAARLCRQNAFWQKVKKAAGKWIEIV